MGQKRRAEMSVAIHVADLPETLWRLRHQLAQILRETAEGESPRVRQRLVDIAAAFEVDQAREE